MASRWVTAGERSWDLAEPEWGIWSIPNRQLATARCLAAEDGIDDIEWVHGNAETVDRPDTSFDFAISGYGAAIWCDPHASIPEAHRLLRRGDRADGVSHWVGADWAKRFPSEQVWILQKP